MIDLAIWSSPHPTASAAILSGARAIGFDASSLEQASRFEGRADAFEAFAHGISGFDERSLAGAEEGGQPPSREAEHRDIPRSISAKKKAEAGLRRERRLTLARGGFKVAP